MFLKFFPQETESQPENEELDVNFSPLKTRTLEKLHFDDDLLFVCLCADMFYNHRFIDDAYEMGKCNSCPCESLSWPEICVELIFTIADLFELETETIAKKDSPQWWIEFKLWLDQHK